MTRRTQPTLLRVALAAGLAIGLAAPASAYIVILKGGKRHTAIDKPEERDGKWIFVVTGSKQRYEVAIADVDVEKTKEANAAGAGDAYVLGDGQGKELPVLRQPDTQRPSLNDRIQALGIKKTPAAAESTGSTSRETATTHTASKSGKPGSRKEEPASTTLDSTISDVFARALSSSNIQGANMSSVPGGVKVTATAANEQQVFAALGAVARGLKEARSGGRSVDKVELNLSDDRGQPAGKFLMSPDDAEGLLNGTVSAAKYFMGSVIF